MRKIKLLALLLLAFAFTACDGEPGPDEWFEWGLESCESAEVIETHATIKENDKIVVQTKAKRNGDTIQCDEPLEEGLQALCTMDVIVDTFNTFEVVQEENGLICVSFHIPESQFETLKNALKIQGDIVTAHGQMVVERRTKMAQSYTLLIDGDLTWQADITIDRLD